MVGILSALRENKFNCYAPAGVDDFNLSVSLNDQDTGRPHGKFLEIPRPEEIFPSVCEISDGDPLLFRYFIDGSQRITNAGYVVDTKKRYLPLIIAQIGVAVTELEGCQLKLKEYEFQNTLLFPDSFSHEDLEDARKVVIGAAKASQVQLELSFDHYEVDDLGNTPPVDKARAKVLSKMHNMEVQQISSLAKAEEISREALLLIDGSIEFYSDMNQLKEAFQNVVGVAKQFDLHKPYHSSSKSERVGSLISRLPPKHRTPARGAKHRNLTIASWYLRLRGRKGMTNLEYPDGVVKIEVYPDDPSHDSPKIERAKCNRISEHVLALRAPATPHNDRRWASHLYPVHLTERYIKTRFHSDKTVRACL